MIEVMEQQIINSISSRWTKDRNKRKEIDMNKLTEAFRVICSSRNTTLSIINRLNNTQKYNCDLKQLKNNMEIIYNWITEDTVKSILEKYSVEIKDKKNEADYKAEIPVIIESLNKLKINIIDETLNKLMKFHSLWR